MMSHHLPNYLRMHRKRSGLAQHEVARLLGCTHGSKVSRHERGQREPTFTTLLVYELIYSVCLLQLFRGKVEEAHREVRRRAEVLHRTLQLQKMTPATKRKLDFLAKVISLPERP